MMQEEASALGVHLRALVEAPDGSTAQVVVDGPVGAADDAAAVRALVEGRSAPAGGGADPGAAGLQGVGRADVLTFEHEHQDSALLERLAAEGVSVQPGPRALTLARDKLAMRRAMDSVGLPQPAWAEVGGDERAIAGGIEDFAAGHGWPVAQTVQEAGICSEVLAPAPGLEEADAARAELIGRTVAERFDVTGVLAVELFAVEEAGRPTALYVNELAMRPHNSGHWTQDGAVTSQFAQHVRAVLDLPLGSPEPTAPATVMVNVLGGAAEPDDGALARALALDPRACVHMYGKTWRPGRKLGHVNLTVPGDPAAAGFGEAVAAALARARAVAAVLRGGA